MIGGNITCVLQVKDEGVVNDVGELVHEWTDLETLEGFLDFMGGENKLATIKGKLQETTHIFVCDYKRIKSTSQNARMVINNNVYQILMIDDPMEKHRHLEIYLKYIGGGLGVG